MSGRNEADAWPEEHSEFVYHSQRKFSGLIDGTMGANYVSQLYDDISRRMVQHVYPLCSADASPKCTTTYYAGR